MNLHFFHVVVFENVTRRPPSFSQGGLRYPVDSAIGFPNIYPQESDLIVGYNVIQCLKQLEPRAN